jgi:hypothetical protein
MRLGLVTCFRRIRMPRGNIWRGWVWMNLSTKFHFIKPWYYQFRKEKFIMEVTDLDKALLREKLKVEEENLFYLRHPYLTMVDMLAQFYVHVTYYIRILPMHFVCLCMNLWFSSYLPSWDSNNSQESREDKRTVSKSKAECMFIMSDCSFYRKLQQ